MTWLLLDIAPTSLDDSATLFEVCIVGFYFEFEDGYGFDASEPIYFQFTDNKTQEKGMNHRDKRMIMGVI